ncbi:MAG: hypothetical protein ABIS50_12080 [Luteolibacter sp.]|uniref:hypothetical protein n=1 Tax=Luteolibacter sp. TaxID=1962973 RepID=UPI0032635407
MHLVSFKAEGRLPETRPEIIIQDSRSLDSRETETRRVGSVVDLDVLKQASIYQNISKGDANTSFDSAETTLRNDLEMISATYREPAKVTGTSDCHAVALTVRQRIMKDSSLVLETVESEVAANPAYSCEIVKSAIEASFAEPDLVVAIVETAIHSSPENMRLISQCAIATSPDSLAGVQALLAKLDPNSGETSSSKSSSKSAKSMTGAVEQIARGQVSANPLDLPPLYLVTPPPIMPPAVTQVNP